MSDVILGDEVLELVGAEIQARTGSGRTIALSIKDGNLTLGGAGRDGDLLITDRAGSVTIALNGERGALHLGGQGQDGDITVRDAAFDQTAHLDGRTGDLFLEGEARATAFLTVSDAALKHDIAPLGGALAAVEQLRAVRYRLDSRPDEARLGLIAQEVVEAVPEAVRNSAGGLSIDHGAVVALLLDAVRELSDQVAALRRGDG